MSMTDPSLWVSLNAKTCIATRNHAHREYVLRALEKLGPEAFDLLMQARNYAARDPQRREFTDRVDRLLGLDPLGIIA